MNRDGSPARDSLSRQSSAVLASTLVSSVLAFVFVLLVANVAGPASRGGLAFLVTLPTLLSFAATMGLETANLHFAARRPDLRAALTWMSLVRGAAWGTAGAVAAGVVAAVAPSVVPEGIPTAALVLTLATTPLMCVQFLLVSLLTGAGRLAPANFVRIAIPGVSIVALVAATVAGDPRIGAAAAAWAGGQAAGAAGAVALTVAVLGRPRRDDRRALRDVARYGLSAHAGNLADLATFRVDTLVLAHTHGTVETGIYAAAVNVAEVLLYLPTAVSSVLLPHRSRAGRTRPPRTGRTLAFVGGASVLAAAAGIVAAPRIVELLYDDSFAPSVEPLRVLLVAMVGMSVRKVRAAEMAAVGRVGAASAVALATFGAVLVLDLVLIPQHGAEGAAWASAVAYVIGGALVVAVSARALRAARLAGRAGDQEGPGTEPPPAA
ncbi:MAG: oligosaccharide flippase family protein [Actinomycetota bacterium]|nr:oligosaccharide flippase family protein [Actinomycetota bacterium]